MVSPCQRSLFKVSVQDVYKRSPRKIPARDPQARSLFSSQILCTKRSLGKHSLQTLHKTFPGKISARGLTTNKKMTIPVLHCSPVYRRSEYGTQGVYKAQHVSCERKRRSRQNCVGHNGCCHSVGLGCIDCGLRFI